MQADIAALCLHQKAAADPSLLHETCCTRPAQAALCSKLCSLVPSRVIQLMNAAADSHPVTYAYNCFISAVRVQHAQQHGLCTAACSRTVLCVEHAAKLVHKRKRIQLAAPERFTYQLRSVVHVPCSINAPG